MKIAIVSGKSEGPTKLNAFDNALTEAGIGDVNLIKVSSMLGKNTEIVELPKFKAGKMVNCVLSCYTSDKKNDTIYAAIALALGDNLGCVVEKSGVGTDMDKVNDDVIAMVEYMMNVRDEKINQLIVKNIDHKVENIGSVVSSVVYLD
ncbi:pyruvoyl-dependent arginine decarboxylase [Methanobrevibacter filiformis]|uniref:arginine decarboxylase n=1 Tax=Methanobrevibacter filiformis TaxID=55758 RepID=A0A165ZUE6_9EURY|nr:arginine decarboxylase, pyruvoyl-dependent [Methanobrevibacter filiformis]KZX11176.1 pyruvoyl-dependent arginine decarboxylase [Methanobrevibacter filiformis]